MLQTPGAPPPDLSTAIAAWLPLLAAVALGIWKVVDLVKAGRKKQQEDQDTAIHKSALPVIRRAEEAERLVGLLEKRVAEEEREKTELEVEVIDLRRKLRDRMEIESELQHKVFNQQGEIDAIDRRLKQLESERLDAPNFNR